MSTISTRNHGPYITRAWETPDGWASCVEHAGTLVYATDGEGRYRLPYGSPPTIHAADCHADPEAAHAAALALAPAVDRVVEAMRAALADTCREAVQA